MEPVGHGDRLHGAVLERDVLCDALAHALGADAGDEPLAHRLLGLDRDHVEPGREQGAAELAGPRCQVENRGAGPQPKLRGERSTNRGGVVRPSALVREGDGGELHGQWMEGHAGSVFA